MSDSAGLEQKYARLAEALEQACARAGRKRGELTLVAVSKFHSAEDIRVVAALGQADFGENYVQEAQAKMEALRDLPDLRWHMIGHVQSRKASAVAGHFKLVHTLDSIKLARGMQAQLEKNGVRQAVLVEVNIAAEPQKSGLMAEKLEELANFVQAECPALELCGLMCLPPVLDSGDAARPYFAKLRGLRDRLAASTGLALPDLSMGMSGDFAAAILEGANIVRIGTDIFGPRPPKRQA